VRVPYGSGGVEADQALPRADPADASSRCIATRRPRDAGFATPAGSPRDRSRDLRRRNRRVQPDLCPFNAWLGIRAVAASAVGVVIEAPWRDELVGSPGLRTMHGGVLAAIVETTAGLSLLAVLGRGRVLRAGGTITCLEAFVHDADDRLVASGRAVFPVPRTPAG
jgi:acyl-coenzyme A thioesterase PaaI-like protein